jgi:hypothetical protein
LETNLNLHDTAGPCHYKPPHFDGYIEVRTETIKQNRKADPSAIQFQISLLKNSGQKVAAFLSCGHNPNSQIPQNKTPVQSAGPTRTSTIQQGGHHTRPQSCTKNPA